MMRRLRRQERVSIPGAILVVSTWAVSAAPAAPPPAEVFGRLPVVQYVTLSPDGKRVAMDDVHAGPRQIVVIELETGATRPLMYIDPSSKLRDLHWADDSTLLVEASIQHSMPCTASLRCNYEWRRTYAVGTDGTPPRVMLMKDPTRQWLHAAQVLATQTGRPHSITMLSGDRMDTKVGERDEAKGQPRVDRDLIPMVPVVFDVDTRTGQGTALAVGTLWTEGWVVDAQGQPVAKSEWRGDKKEFTVSVRKGDKWDTLYAQTDRGGLQLAGLTPDGKSIVALGYNGGDLEKAWTIALDGSGLHELFGDPKGDVDTAIADPVTNAVVAVKSSSMQPQTHWLDARQGSQQRSLQSAFAGKLVDVIDRSTDGQRVLVRVDSLSAPPVFQLVDFARSRAEIVAESYPELARAQLGESRAIEYFARDGKAIPAYLTLPPGGTRKNLPLVVMPHGGPEARDDAHFFYLAQFIATRGYAVLQPQFRGSTGLGEAFRNAGRHQWGGLMQDDVTDGVRHLIADGTADPSRICIVGASYGGYSALAGAAYTSGLYACAASIAGVSDLPLMLIEVARQRGGDSDTIAYWLGHIGEPMDPKIAARSPARSVATIGAPILLMHGIDDSIVPILQSETMSAALRKAGKPVKFVKLKGEDHWLSQSDTRLQVLQELEKFLAQYLH